MKYDIMMLDEKVQNGVALVMEKAFWDHIITEMNIGNYNSYIGLFSEIKQMLCYLISGQKDLSNQINQTIESDLKKYDLQIFYSNIVFIYEKIKEYGLPENDENIDLIIKQIHSDFSNIRNLDKNKTLLEYIKNAFDLIKDLIRRKSDFLENIKNNNNSVK